MKTVFTNGCFDILHRGHLELLWFCRSLGDLVVVGINSDNSVRNLKGESRPINKAQDRKFFLESLSCVDEVIVFDEETPLELIKNVKPDIIVKGGDYSVEDVVGHNLAKVIIFDTVNGYSTTNIIKNISDR